MVSDRSSNLLTPPSLSCLIHFHETTGSECKPQNHYLLCTLQNFFGFGTACDIDIVFDNAEEIPKVQGAVFILKAGGKRTMLHGRIRERVQNHTPATYEITKIFSYNRRPLLKTNMEKMKPSTFSPEKIVFLVMYTSHRLAARK